MIQEFIKSYLPAAFLQKVHSCVCGLKTLDSRLQTIFKGNVMKPKYFTLLFVFTLFVAAESQAQTLEAAQFIKGEVVVEIKPGASIDAINARHRTKTIQQIYKTNFYRLATPANKSENKWRKRLRKDEDVLSAELNALVTSPSLFGRSTQSFPDGFASVGFHLADYAAQQQLYSWLKLEDVQLRSRGAGVIVAVIDTGIDPSHSLLSTKMWRDERGNADLANDGFDNDGDGLFDDSRGWDFVDNDNDPTDKPDDPAKTVAGHGTFIAGLIATLAPDARLLPVRAFGPDGMGNAFTVAAAIKYAADHGAMVINLSLGSSEASTLLQEAITDARQRGIVVVAAVGNDNDELAPQFPSSMDEVIAVAAIDLQNKKAPFSNFGHHIDVCAPGVKLISAYPNEGDGGYAIWSGTSFAAPLAAAEAALLLAVDPKQPDIKKVIEDSAREIDSLNPGLAGKLGKGSIDPLNALQSLPTSAATRDLYSEIALTSGPTIPEARGKASISVAGAKQSFRVEAYNLSVRTTYDLLVDGVAVVTDQAATSLGSLTFEFLLGLNTSPLNDSISPVTNIRHLEVRATTGQFVILQGDFKTNSSEASRRSVEKETRLVPLTTSPRLAGRATVKMLADYQELTIIAEGLQTGATYRLVVDGISLGSQVVVSGFIRAHLTTNLTGEQFLPFNVRPVTNIRRVELVTSRGELVLRGDFTANATAVSSR
jgi:subtilisin family serine protease